MSLRKSPQLTPRWLAAAPKNAQHSAGPRSAAAQQNSKLNALNSDGRWYVAGGGWGRTAPPHTTYYLPNTGRG
jgi:hypothetical protein